MEGKDIGWLFRGGRNKVDQLKGKVDLYTTHATAQAIDSKSHSFDSDGNSSAASVDGAGHQAGHCATAQLKPKLIATLDLAIVSLYVSKIPPKNPGWGVAHFCWRHKIIVCSLCFVLYALFGALRAILLPNQ